MKRDKTKKIVVTVLALSALAAVIGLLFIDRGDTRAQAATPAEMIDAAEEMIRTEISNPELRTEAIWLYEDALAGLPFDDPESRALKARAHMGLALLNLFDFFDLLPALSSFLGIDLIDLFNPAPSPPAPATPFSASGLIQPSALCTPVDFEDYLYTVDQMLTNMLTPTIDHLREARALDPNVTITIENGLAALAPTMVLDLAGEWDAADAAMFQGALEILLGGLKILTSYDGILQNLINPTMSPDCTPVPASDEWTAIFGPYNQIVDGGTARMTEAGALLAEGLQAFANGLNLMVAEIDDQSDDVIRYYDVGIDGLGPGDVGYPGSDAGEGNNAYDLGEPWGMPSVGDFLSGLLDGLLGGAGGIDLGEISMALSPPVLAGAMEALGQSAETGAPVDLIPTLFKPLFESLGGAPMTDQDLYMLGLPALNLGALFNPPLEDFSVIDPLKDSNGIAITDTETGDTTHAWPDGSGRVDDLNGVVDAIYFFYPDVWPDGSPRGVWGGLIIKAVTEPADFDGSGNLIGEVDYESMMNPDFNILMGVLGALLP